MSLSESLSVESSQTLGDSLKKPGVILGFAAIAVAASTFFWPTFFRLMAIYAADEDFSHGIFVPLVSACLGWQIVQRSHKESLTPSWFGPPVLLSGVLFVLLGRWYQIALMPMGLGVAFLEASGVIIAVAGLCLCAFGRRRTRMLAFPLLYLIFAIPIPKSITLPLTAWLRHQVSVLSETIVRAVGVTVYREGNVLHLASTSLGIEDACSGIRSFWILMAGAAAIAYVLNLGARRGCFLCVAMLPISIVTNVLRVVVTAVLINFLGSEVASGWRHDLLGWGTFSAGLLLTIAIACALVRPETKKSDLSDGVDDVGGPVPAKLMSYSRPNYALLCVTVAVLVIGVATGRGVVNHYLSIEQQSVKNRQLLADLPDNLGEFRKVQDGIFLEEHLTTLQASDHLMRRYVRGENIAVELTALYWEPTPFDRNDIAFGLSGHIPDNCFPAWGFEAFPAYSEEIDVDFLAGKSVSSRLFRKLGSDYVVMFWHKKRFEREFPNRVGTRLAALISSWNNPYLDHGSQHIVTVTIPVLESRDSAKQVGLDFARALVDVLPKFGFI